MKGFVVDVRESTARVSRELRLHMASRKDSAMRGERERRRVRSKRGEIGKRKKGPKEPRACRGTKKSRELIGKMAELY